MRRAKSSEVVSWPRESKRMVWAAGRRLGWRSVEAKKNSSEVEGGGVAWEGTWRLG